MPTPVESPSLPHRTLHAQKSGEGGVKIKDKKTSVASVIRKISALPRRKVSTSHLLPTSGTSTSESYSPGKVSLITRSYYLAGLSFWEFELLPQRFWVSWPCIAAMLLHKKWSPWRKPNYGYVLKYGSDFWDFEMRPTWLFCHLVFCYHEQTAAINLHS